MSYAVILTSDEKALKINKEDFVLRRIAFGSTAPRISYLQIGSFRGEGPKKNEWFEMLIGFRIS